MDGHISDPSFQTSQEASTHTATIIKGCCLGGAKRCSDERMHKMSAQYVKRVAYITLALL